MRAAPPPTMTESVSISKAPSRPASRSCACANTKIGRKSLGYSRFSAQNCIAKGRAHNREMRHSGWDGRFALRDELTRRFALLAISIPVCAFTQTSTSALGLYPPERPTGKSSVERPPAPCLQHGAEGRHAARRGCQQLGWDVRGQLGRRRGHDGGRRHDPGLAVDEARDAVEHGEGARPERRVVAHQQLERRRVARAQVDAQRPDDLKHAVREAGEQHLLEKAAHVLVHVQLEGRRVGGERLDLEDAVLQLLQEL